MRKTLLSFSKNEYIGFGTLIVLLALFMALPYLISLRKPNPENIAVFKRIIDSLTLHIMPSVDTETVSMLHFQRKEKYHAELVYFDPNTADIDIFQQLGFSPKQATAIINYRLHGAIFRNANDFARVFVVSPEHFIRLKPYIRIDTTKFPTSMYTMKRDNSHFAERERQIIEINVADTTELQLVRGIGYVTAKRIIAYRVKLGGYASIEQLRELQGMTNDRFEQIAPQIMANQALIKQINLQTTDETTLKAHPYIGAYMARGIIHFRNVYGVTNCTIDALVKNNVIKEDMAEKLKPYIVE